MASPFLEGLVGGLGEAEVGNSTEALFYAVIFIGGQHFQSAKDTEFIAERVAGFVLATFAAGQGHLESGDAVAAHFERKHPTIFVVRMRRGVHEASGGVEFAQGFLEAHRSAVLRYDGFFGKGEGRKDKERDNKARSREVGSDSESEVDGVPPK